VGHVICGSIAGRIYECKEDLHRNFVQCLFERGKMCLLKDYDAWV